MSKVDQQGQAEDVQFWNAKKCYTETGCSTEFVCIYKQLFKGLGKVFKSLSCSPRMFQVKLFICVSHYWNSIGNTLL